MSVKLYEVGGCVRDGLLGVPTKDVDFLVIASSFEAMQEHIDQELGLRTYLAKPEFATIRAGVPKRHPLRKRCKDADFVLARKDGPSTDGRRPDFVEPGSLEDDLRRRDFTMNALARDVETDELVDLFNGGPDIQRRLIRFVGEPMDRIREDGLRVLRALRFSVTKEFELELSTRAALYTEESVEMLRSVSVERIREELEKMLRCDTVATLRLFEKIPTDFRSVIFRDGLRLGATFKG